MRTGPALNLDPQLDLNCKEAKKRRSEGQSMSYGERFGSISLISVNDLYT